MKLNVPFLTKHNCTEPSLSFKTTMCEDIVLCMHTGFPRYYPLTLPGHAKMPMAQKVSEIEKEITNLQLWMRFQVDAICLHQRKHTK
jgi:hypothetical protein